MMSAAIIVGGIVLLLVLLAGLIWVLGSRAKARLAAKYPPPGKMVDVGGYRLHINSQGTLVAGSPTVVMETAHSEPGLSWAGVQPEVAKFTRVCTYDRAGLGWSEPSPKPRTAPNIVEELHTLLARAGIEPPYVLVGHSIGGMYARLYAHEHPGEVAGMVMVDAAHEEQLARMPEAIAKMQATSTRAMGCLFGLLKAMSSVGLLVPLTKVKGGVGFMPIPREGRAAYLATVYSGPKYFEAAKRETLALQESYAAVRARQIRSLGDIPLIVISAGRPAITAGHGISEADAEQFKALAAELHTEMAALSPRGKRVIAEESGHYVPVDQPQVVVDAIREVVEAARSETEV
jgi:pimeloyl-ACP methyl ester carboxylesterase